MLVGIDAGIVREYQMVKVSAEASLTLGELINRANAARRKGDRAASWRHLELARSHDPDGKSAALEMLHCDMLLDDGRDAEAVAALKKCTQSHPDDNRPFARLAMHARRQQDSAAAWRYLEAALARDPEGRNMGLRRLQIDMLRDAGRLGEAPSSATTTCCYRFSAAHPT